MGWVDGWMDDTDTDYVITEFIQRAVYHLHPSSSSPFSSFTHIQWLKGELTAAA